MGADTDRPKDKALKQIGAMMLLNMETGIEAYTMAAATRIIGMSSEDAKKLCDDAWRDVKNKNNHCYNYQWVSSLQFSWTAADFLQARCFRAQARGLSTGRMV